MDVKLYSRVRLRGSYRDKDLVQLLEFINLMMEHSGSSKSFENLVYQRDLPEEFDCEIQLCTYQTIDENIDDSDPSARWLQVIGDWVKAKMRYEDSQVCIQYHGAVFYQVVV